jgi:hypothetical protein
MYSRPTAVSLRRLYINEKPNTSDTEGVSNVKQRVFIISTPISSTACVMGSDLNQADQIETRFGKIPERRLVWPFPHLQKFIACV